MIFFSCQKGDISTDEFVPLLGQWEEFDQKVNRLEDNIEKDLLLLRLAIQQPSYSTALCRRVISNNAKEKCKQVIGRPHLTAPKPK